MSLTTQPPNHLTTALVDGFRIKDLLGHHAQPFGRHLAEETARVALVAGGTADLFDVDVDVDFDGDGDLDVDPLFDGGDPAGPSGAISFTSAGGGGIGSSAG